jgi:hypothetical protein
MLEAIVVMHGDPRVGVGRAPIVLVRHGLVCLIPRYLAAYLDEL